MRLGEMKNIIGKCINENNQLFIDSKPEFGGQAYVINNYRDLVEAINLLSDQPWNEQDYSEINEIFKKYDLARINIINSSEFSKINSYISAVNKFIPIFYSILESMTVEQDEKVINIKLPTEIKSLMQLTDFNKRIGKILDCLTVDSQFEFIDFDTGTSWYKIIATGNIAYLATIGCLQIAQEALKTRAEYYNSQQSEIDYRASLKNADAYDKKEKEVYIENRNEVTIDIKIENLVKNLPIKKGGHTDPELKMKLVTATKLLASELEHGTEFHLSLNPPEYAEEFNGQLKVDYELIKKISEEKIETKKLPEPTPE